MRSESYYRRLGEIVDSGVCPKCQEKSNGIDEQYSFGEYAGIMCRSCAVSGFRDQCGYGPSGQGDPRELDEPMYDENGSEEGVW